MTENSNHTPLLLIGCVIIMFMLGVNHYVEQVYAGVGSLNKPYKPYKPTNRSQDPDELTIVTAFINIGGFRKGPGYREVTIYQIWMKSFRFIENPVVAFFDDDMYLQMFHKIRSKLPAELTIINKINKKDLWAFSLLNKTKNVASNPKHPFTSPPKYACAMHAKYDFVYRVLNTNPFRTKYIAWLDLGLWRHIAEQNVTNFHMYPPNNLDKHKVAFSQVQAFRKQEAKEIFFRSQNWVSGSMFLATNNVMRRWVKQYKHYAELFLNNGLTASDQQVIYAMYASDNAPKDVSIQTFSGRNKNVEAYFFLGHVAKDTKRKKP